MMNRGTNLPLPPLAVVDGKTFIPIREFNPLLGDMGRGVPISKAELPGLAKAFAGLGFTPFVVQRQNADEFGEPFPIYSPAGGLCAAVWRGWTRERNGKFEAVAVEVNSLLKDVVRTDTKG